MRKYPRFRNWSALLGLLAFQACVEADLPLPVDGDPVFTIDGTLAGSPYHLAAGDDDRVLVPGTAIASGEIKEYTAAFIHQIGDIVHPDQLTFTFRSSEAGNNAPGVDTDLAPGIFAFYKSIPADTLVQHFVFHSTVENGFPPYDYLWEFGNGIISTKANPEITFDENDPIENVKLQVWDVFGKHASYATNFLPDAAPLKANFYTSPAVTEVVVNLDVSGGVPPYTHNWNVTNNSASVFSMPAVSVLLDSICLTVIDDDNNTAEVCKMLADPSSGSLFSALYDYEKVIQPEDFQLSTVTITLTDDNGKVFSSSLDNQPPSSYLEILENQPYENYINGLKTHRLKIRYDCVLFSADGESKAFSGEGFIGVGSE